jgi:hypothetical protein
MAYGVLDVDHARSVVEGRAFQRVRRGENVYVPGREGRSWGMEVTGRWRIGSRPEIFGALSVEKGEGWREHQLNAGGRLTLP